MLSAPGGPVAVQASPGHTTDPNTVPGRVVKLQERFGLEPVVLVGGRGLLTQVQIEHLKRHRGLGWVSALKSLQIRVLVEQDALQLSLFDEQNLAESVSEDYPGERLVACYNPLLAEERSRKREELLCGRRLSPGEGREERSRKREELLAATEAGLERVAREAARRTRTPLGRRSSDARWGGRWGGTRWASTSSWRSRTGGCSIGATPSGSRLKRVWTASTCFARASRRRGCRPRARFAPTKEGLKNSIAPCLKRFELLEINELP